MGGGQRWLGSEEEDINIAGTNYRVNWIRVAPQEIDFRTHRNDFGSFIVIMPDTITEEQANERAAAQLATRLCGNSEVSTVSSGKDGDMYIFSMRCGNSK